MLNVVIRNDEQVNADEIYTEAHVKLISIDIVHVQLLSILQMDRCMYT